MTVYFQQIPLDTTFAWSELRGTLLVLTTREEHEQQHTSISITIEDDDVVTETRIFLKPSRGIAATSDSIVNLRLTVAFGAGK